MEVHPVAYSETPIYPGKMLTGQAPVASGSNTAVAIVTAPASYPAIIKGPICCIQKGSTQRVLQIQIKNGATVTMIGRATVDAAQYTAINLLSSTYIPGIDDTNPEIRLNPGEILQVTPEDSVASAIDITALNAMSYEYPNA
jgi:hypothetical protein